MSDGFWAAASAVITSVIVLTGTITMHLLTRRGMKADAAQARADAKEDAKAALDGIADIKSTVNGHTTKLETKIEHLQERLVVAGKLQVATELAAGDTPNDRATPRPEDSLTPKEG